MVEELDKQKFGKIFEACMGVNIVYYPDGSRRTESPRIVIRDLDTDTSDMCESGVWDVTKIDKEFTDLENAWQYFRTLDRVRVMDVSGLIYFDYDGLSESGTEAIK